MSILRFKDKDDNWVSVPSLVGPPGADGIQGPPGPNEINRDTATTLTGIIKGDGSTVTTATPGEDYAAGKHAPQHAADGADPLTPGMIGALEYDDISGRSAFGTLPRFDGVFPGTEMEHTVLYGKSTQDGTPSPDAPVEIVDFAPGMMWCGGRNLARLDDRIYVISTVTVEMHKDTVRVSNSGNATTPISCVARLRLPPTVLGKTVTAYFMAIGSNPSNAPYASLGTFDLNINNTNNAVKPEIRGYSGDVFTTTFPVSMPDNIYPCLSLSVSIGTSLKGDYCDFTDIMIVEGEYTAETMPSYTPYTGATYPVNLTLRGIPVNDGGNYTDETGQQYIADTYDVVTGEYVQRVGVINSYASEAVETPYMSTTGDLTAGAHVLYILAAPIVTRLDPQQVLAYSPTTQISAGGGYIGAKLGAAMAPVRTTPQELTQAQMLQALGNLGLTVDTETGAVTWGTATAESETTEQTV